MSYKLEKPYTDEDYANFVVEHNHNNGRMIEESETAVYALEPNEIMLDGEPVINPNYELELKEMELKTRISKIKHELAEIDRKRIRAMCEPSEYTKGLSWLEKYNQEAQDLRTELQELERISQ